MKKNNNYFLALVVVLFTMTGCNKFLEVDPLSQWKDETFYSSREEVDIALAGIYGRLANDALYGWQFNVRLEAGTDETYANGTQASWNASIYGHTPSNDDIKNMWLRFYSAIQLVNQFEKNLKADMFSENVYNQLLAKARFMRGFCHFTLANWFGPVPLRLKPSENQADNHLAPSPVKDVYESVERDLLFAAEHLLHAKDAGYVPGEPNKMAAHGLLARLYLKMGGYQPYLSPNTADCYLPNPQQYFVKAKDQCEIIINDGWHKLNPSYREHFLHYLQDKYDLRESLYEISFGNLYSMGIAVSGRLGNINGVSFTGATDIPRGFQNVNAGLMVSTKYPGEDLRRDWSIAAYRNTSAFRITAFRDNPLHQNYAIGKFRRWEPTDMAAVLATGSTGLLNAAYTILNNTPGSETDANFTSINFPILRYSDVLLMHAEAIIGGRYGTGDADDAAVQSLDLVRERAGLDPYTGSRAHADFFNELVDERLRELCFEGIRKQDLIRWDLLEDKLAESTAAIKAHSRFVATNSTHTAYVQAGDNFDRSRHLLLPYPEQETEINNKLDQRRPW